MSSRRSPGQAVPLADRLVEVIADLGESVGPRYRYGSGLIVRGRTVLTAAHVVAGAEKVQVRGPDKSSYAVRVDPRFVGDPGGPGPDLALLEIERETLDLPPVGLARVDRDAPTADPVERCHAIGYPWFAESRSPGVVRETVDAIGVVPVLSRLAAGLLSVHVSISPRPLPPEQASLGESEWSGMSGAPVVAAGLLLGVVIEHAQREGSSAITAVPLTALEHDSAHPGWGPGVADPAAWWSRLGVASVEELKRLPAPAERTQPAYRETLREFGRTLHQRMPQLLGREKELAEIASFASGPSGYRWLVGGAYAGKTALLFEAVMVGLPVEVDAEVDVVSYFLSRRASDADSNRFLAATVPQLAHLCGVDLPPPSDRDQFNALWRRATEQAEESGRHLLLVVDGLDEDLHPTGSPSVASLLPTLVGASAHVLVASRPYPELPVDVPDGHPLWATSPMELEPFEGASEFAALARQEIDDLTRGDDLELAVEVLGLLTAAAGPLSVRDLADLSISTAASSPTHTVQVRRFVTERAGRSLEPVGSETHRRYEFAHYSLLEYANKNDNLADPEFRNRIHRWAEQWRDRGWPTTTDGATTTPRYLLDNYSAALTGEPDRLAALVTDAGWVDAAIQSVGVERVLADLRSAAAAAPTHATVRAMLAVARGQAHHLSPARPLAQPGYVSQQLWLQAAELSEDRLAEQFRARLQAQPAAGLVPLWTTRRVSRALLRELGRHDGRVTALAALPDGRVVSGGDDGRVLLWDAAEAGSQPVELGRHYGPVAALAALPDGRVVSGGGDRRVRLWDVTTQSEITQLGCSSTALAAGHPDRDGTSLVIAHAGAGLSFWSIAGGGAPW
jgi:Trypsin-like peptidase domain/WD domain, G-beta repeat